MHIYIIVGIITAFALLITFGPWFRGWRTVIVNTAIAAFVPMIELMAYLETVDWRQYVPPEYAPWALMAVTVINIFLRAKTTTPVGQK